MGNLLIFDEPVRCHAYADVQRMLFCEYLIAAGDTGLVSGDQVDEWIVLVGDTLLVIRKDARGVRILK